MTVHQAKGREWDRVGIRITDRERAILAAGLDSSAEAHRPLYVACTRARYQTAELLPATR
jgi:DNA helicase-2/ATP-dependent DNA helicase PcrA